MIFFGSVIIGNLFIKLEASKATLRKRFLTKRSELSQQDKETQSLAIANHCLQLPIWEKEFFHLFLPIATKGEIDTTFLLTLLQGRDKQVVLPKVQGDKLLHFLLTDSTKLKRNPWGIPEPEQGLAIAPEQLDVVFIPLLAWDKEGHRVGYGKGFYDSFLSRCKPEVIKIGLSFFEAVESISDLRPEDVPLDFCVTPLGVQSFVPN